MKGDIRPLNGHSISFPVTAQATQGNFCQGDKTIIKNRAQFRGCQWAMTPPNTNKQPFGLFFSIFFFIFFLIGEQRENIGFRSRCHIKKVGGKKKSFYFDRKGGALLSLHYFPFFFF